MFKNRTKYSTFYMVAEVIYGHAIAITKDGFGTPSEPCEKIDYGVSNTELERFIIHLLDCTKYGVDNSTNSTSGFKSILKLSKINSYKNFTAQAQCVSISLNRNIFEIEPFRFNPKNSSYTGIEEKIVKVKKSSDCDIGRLLKEAFEYCE